MKKTIKTTFIAIVLSSIISPSIHAENSNLIQTDAEIIKSRFIENSYIVTFKGPEEGFSRPVIAPDKTKINNRKVPFGMHSTGQSKKELAKYINLKGEIISIFESINAVHVNMDSKEADRLSRQRYVRSVEQDRVTTLSAIQNNPGWGLDRIDEPSANIDNNYDYNSTGAGQTIYILDSGLNLQLSTVRAEFGTRASILWDVNGDGGEDCNGHGSRVSSAAAGNTYGVAKGATLLIVKITDGCTNNAAISTSVFVFNWLAVNAPAGTIVNWSNLFSNPLSACNPRIISTTLEASIRAAHNAGIIVVVPAGNDNCNTANFSPTRISEAFVVGATNNSGFPGTDRKANFSRTGWNISTFAPGQNLPLMGRFGQRVIDSGTSFSAPYVAGTFAVVCEAAGTLCNTTPTVDLYRALRGTGTLNTVTNTNGTPLTGATSRFISQQW